MLPLFLLWIGFLKKFVIRLKILARYSMDLKTRRSWHTGNASTSLWPRCRPSVMVTSSAKRRSVAFSWSSLFSVLWWVSWGTLVLLFEPIRCWIYFVGNLFELFSKVLQCSWLFEDNGRVAVSIFDVKCQHLTELCNLFAVSSIGVKLNDESVSQMWLCIWWIFSQAMFASSLPEIMEIVGNRSKYRGSYKKEHGKRSLLLFCYEDNCSGSCPVLCYNGLLPLLLL